MLDRVADHSTRPDIDGLTLRAPDRHDVEHLIAAGGDPGIAASLPGLPRNRAEARQWIAGTGARYLIADGDRVLGGLEMHDVRPGTGEVTYWVLPGARGHGVATGAVRRLADWALHSQVSRLEIVTDVANVAAQRVALGAGFSREGVRRGGRIRVDGIRADEVLWSRLPGDPSAPRPRRLPDLTGGELRDDRVVLRPLGPSDAHELFTLMNLPDVVRRQVPPGPSSREQIAQRCTHAAADWLAGGRAGLSMRDAATGSFAGEITLTPDGLTGEGWIGYSLLPAWRGLGFTKRAVRLLSRWALDAGFPRLCAGTMADNVASQRVLEGAGFTLEGIRRAELPGLNGARNDDYVYVLLRG